MLLKGAAPCSAALKPVGQAPPPSVRGRPIKRKTKSTLIEVLDCKSRMSRIGSCIETTRGSQTSLRAAPGNLPPPASFIGLTCGAVWSRVLKKTGPGVPAEGRPPPDCKVWGAGSVPSAGHRQMTPAKGREPPAPLLRMARPLAALAGIQTTHQPLLFPISLLEEGFSQNNPNDSNSVSDCLRATPL